jgi:ankyrin repeat protein
MKSPIYYREKDALVIAAYLEETKVFEQLIAEGADPNCRDEIGQTPLHVAADQGSTGLVRRLLFLGADPNITDFDGDTPLDIAFFREHTDVATLLESIGARSRGHIPPGEILLASV